MNLEKANARRSVAREQISQVIETYYNDGVSRMPEDKPVWICAHECHKKLSPEVIYDGLTAFMIYTGVSQGTCGGFELNRLVEIYLLNLGKRYEINKLLV